MIAVTGALIVFSTFCGANAGLSRSFCSSALHEHDAHWQRIGAGRSHLGEINSLAQERLGHWTVEPAILAAGRAKQLVERLVVDGTRCEIGFPDRFHISPTEVAAKTVSPLQHPTCNTRNM
jgi:hypothetical protein